MARRRSRPLRRVVLAVGTLGRGGTERQMYLLARALVQRGVHVSVVVFEGGGPYGALFEDAGVRIHVATFLWFPEDRWRAIVRVPRRLAALVRWLREERPDVIHAYLFWAYVVATVAGRLGRVPVVVSGRRSLGDYKADVRLRAPMEVCVNLLTDAVVANSQAVVDDTLRRERFVRTKMHLIPNGIEADHFAACTPAVIDTAAPVILCVGNLRPVKGHTFLITAARLLAERGVETTILLAGQGPDPVREALEAEADGLDVRFLGDRQDIGSLLARADVVVSPSTAEGMSNAVMEAMAAGKAIVATAVGGTTELLGDAGVLVPPRDPECMADSIERLLADGAERGRLGAAASARAKDFAVEVMVDRHVHLYEELLA